MDRPEPLTSRPAHPFPDPAGDDPGDRRMHFRKIQDQNAVKLSALFRDPAYGRPDALLGQRLPAFIEGAELRGITPGFLSLRKKKIERARRGIETSSGIDARSQDIADMIGIDRGCINAARFAKREDPFVIRSAEPL